MLYVLYGRIHNTIVKTTQNPPVEDILYLTRVLEDYSKEVYYEYDLRAMRAQIRQYEKLHVQAQECEALLGLPESFDDEYH